MKYLKKIIHRFSWLEKILYSFYTSLIVKRKQKQLLKTIKLYKNETNKIFYLGVPAHPNLGDLAQGVCIRRWIKKHYKDKIIIEIETDVLLNSKVFSEFKKAYKKDDLIIFQSGYTTTDLGGRADEMHREVINAFPDAKILMMPQTIYFKSKENEKRTSECYNQASKMLFLARDKISFESAKRMFPDIRVELFPDIVTTLIGTKEFSKERKGILFCCRNDSEKYYSDDEITLLMEKCKALDSVAKTDTTKKGDSQKTVNEAENFINNEIDKYSKYRLIITDRYHGTILSLVAGTPVIIIKTTDHKVITGADWFKGVYDEYVYTADNLEDAYKLANKIFESNISYRLNSYFEEKYYDKLKDLFELN